jgi:hypothetical protein
VGVGGRCNKKRDDPAWIAPFGSPLLLCATRFGAMHSPSGSLLTPRVSFWTHWRSFDRHVPRAAVVSLDLKVSSYRGFA